ncbi:MAG: chorismate synthase [Firmicutes bacterium]|nr:chorismate synthase [[Eubacterium] siraeum]MCM1487237.1 chorismate synthase [Bacillota bacterium]
MSSTINFGNLSVSVFGESHGKAIGAVLDGIPGGEKLDLDGILSFMSRRAPKKDGTSTARNEADLPHIISGVVDNITAGTPICAVIQNTDQHSNDYRSVSHLARPGHADYTGYIRYNKSCDLRGGGHFSGRLTAPLCFAGAVCGQILENRGITTGAHILRIFDIKDEKFDPVSISKDQLSEIKSKSFPLIDSGKEEEIKAKILQTRNELNSVGGIIECAAVGVPAGIGSPMFDGLENRIAQAVFGIPAVKGIEFGAGFNSAFMTGKENNDEFYLDDNVIKTVTNNHGGILGGISSGMPIVFRTAIKPTPSIAQPQNTVDYVKMTESVLQIKGRHDPCIVPRAVPCVEAALNIVLMSYFC